MAEIEDSLGQQFLIAEYESLKEELKDLVSEMNLMARYAVIGSAAIFTFITSIDKVNHQFDNYIIWLPLILSGLFAFRTYSLYKRLQLISKYIEKEIEIHFSKKNGLGIGWETYLNKSIKKIIFFHRSKAQLSTIVFWAALLVCCFLFPFFSHFLGGVSIHAFIRTFNYKIHMSWFVTHETNFSNYKPGL